MQTYRKRPLQIQAIRLTQETMQEVSALPGVTVYQETGLHGTEEGDLCFADIETLEGKMTAAPGDWIIRGIEGELYPCRDDIFRQTYEPVLDYTFMPSEPTHKRYETRFDDGPRLSYMDPPAERPDRYRRDDIK